MDRQPLLAQHPLEVPGFEVLALLGRGGSGEVWLAREYASGDLVALKRLARARPGDAGGQLGREAALLGGIDHPHVLRLRRVVTAAETDGGTADLLLVLDVAAGGSLAALLADRGRLTAGEVVTVVAPLAEALAAAHAQGVVHGDVTPANVLFTADGRPMLADLGVARLVGAGRHRSGATPGFADPAEDDGSAGDVHGLAATCVAALTGEAPYDELGRRRLVGGADRLLEVLERGLHPDPARRPTAAELAVAAFDAAPAQPVRLTGALSSGALAALGPSAGPVTHQVRPAAAAEPVKHPDGRRRGGRHARPGAQSGRREKVGRLRVRRPSVRRPRFQVSLSAVLVTVVAVACLASTAVVGRALVAPNGAPEGASAVRRTDWAAVLDRLDQQRAEAFASGDPVLLDRVYTDDSPAADRDRRLLAQLTEAGLRADGLRLEVVDVDETGRSSGEVRLRVVDRLGRFTLVDGFGRAVESRPGRGLRTWRVVLHQSAGETWQMHEVSRS